MCIRDRNNSLLIIDSETGSITKKIEAGKSEYYQTPKFIDDENIVMTLVDGKGKHIVKFNLKSEKPEMLFSSGYAEMSRPNPIGNLVYFNASFTGIDNIFALNTSSNKVWQVTSSRFGARDAFVDSTNQNLIYSDYTSDGYLSLIHI